MANQKTSEPAADMAQLERGPEKEDVEKLHEETDTRSSDSDNISNFSESRHVEGPPSGRLSRTTSHRLEKVTSTTSNALSIVRSRVPRRPFSHPLEHTKTSPDVIVDFDGEDDPYAFLVVNIVDAGAIRSRSHSKLSS